MSAPTPPVASQVFDHDPSAEALSGFLDPHRRAFKIRIIDTPRTIRVTPGRIPLVPAALVALAFAGLGIWGLLYLRSTGQFQAHHLSLLLLAMGSILVVLTTLAIINRRIAARGDHCAYDMQTQTLELPQAGVTLRRDQIVRLVELAGLHLRRESLGFTPHWYVELSLLARDGDGRVRRHFIATDTREKPVRALTRRLSMLLDVPVQQVQSDPRAIHASLDSAQTSWRKW